MTLLLYFLGFLVDLLLLIGVNIILAKKDIKAKETTAKEEAASLVSNIPLFIILSVFSWITFPVVLGVFLIIFFIFFGTKIEKWVEDYFSK